jgi:hypothetical protein
MQGSYKPALKRKILTNGLNEKSRREPRLKSRVRMHHNNLFRNLNLSYNLLPNQPYNLLKLPPKLPPELPLELPLELTLELPLKPEYPNRRYMNSFIYLIKETEATYRPNYLQT